MTTLLRTLERVVTATMIASAPAGDAPQRWTTRLAETFRSFLAGGRKTAEIIASKNVAFPQYTHEESTQISDVPIQSVNLRNTMNKFNSPITLGDEDKRLITTLITEGRTALNEAIQTGTFDFNRDLQEHIASMEAQLRKV